MNGILLQHVREALSGIFDPENGRDTLSGGSVLDLHAGSDGKVRLTLYLERLPEKEASILLERAVHAVRSVRGVTDVSTVMTAHRKQAPSGPAVPPPHASSGKTKKPPGMQIAARNLAKAGKLVVIASGKGGVGKSTVAAGIAVTLAGRGLKTGLMDADIHGPSVPALFGLSGQDIKTEGGKMIPPRVCGVTVMSVGLVVEPARALAWRGPMVMGAVRQLVGEVDWGPLDILLVDTPPGTGDVMISLIQSQRIAGAVIVSTPQQIALDDVYRGAALFRKTGIPLVGIVENMSWLSLPGGKKQYIFGHGDTVRKAAHELDAPFLGSLPVYPELARACDAGKPENFANGVFTEDFEKLCDRIIQSVSP